MCRELVGVEGSVCRDQLSGVAFRVMSRAAPGAGVRKWTVAGTQEPEAAARVG